MTVTSVIDIDINDEAFRNFAKLFEKYQSALKETPTAWADAGKESAAVATNTALTAESLVAALLAKEKLSELEKKAAEEEKRRLREQYEYTHRYALLWDKIAQGGKDFSRSILSTSQTLAKWASIGTVGGGLLGVGSLFGIDALAAGAGARRRSAQGLGVSVGQQQAFETNYGRLVDPHAFLSGVNQALTDATQRYSLYGAGLRESDISGRNAAQVSTQLIPLLKRLADQTPDGLLAQTVQARGLGNLGIGVEDLQRLKRTPQSELGQFAAEYAKNQRDLNLQDDVAKKWQDLDIRLRTAGKTIETVFIRGLTPLTKPLEHLSESVTNAVTAFLKNPHLGEWIDSFGQALEKGAKYIGTKEFQDNIKTFVDDTAYAAKKMVEILRFLGLVPDRPVTAAEAEKSIGAHSAYGPGGSKEQAGDKFIRKFWGGIQTWWSGHPNSSNPGNLRIPGKGTGYATFQNSDTGVQAIARQLHLYAKRDHLDTISKIVARYAPKSDHNDVKAYVSDVSRRTGFGATQHLDLNDKNTLASLISAILKHENIKKNSGYSPQAVVKILDKTGGNVTVQVSSLAK